MMKRTLAAMVLALVGVSPASASAATMPPEISMHFGASSVPVNGSTSLLFSIGNPNFDTGLAAVSFSVFLPVGLVVATPNGQSGDCGGTVVAAAGSSWVTLSDGALARGSVCQISVNVRATWGGQKSTGVRVNGGGLGGNESDATLMVTVPRRARVYWTAVNGVSDFPRVDAISFANLDGTGGGDLTGTGTMIPPAGAGVALDPAAGKIYWANYSLGISFANLDGTGGGDLVTTSATRGQPQGMALDAAAGKIYWANVASNDPVTDYISFAKLDGSGGGDLVTTGATVAGPAGVALDPVAGKIYWANKVDDSISFAKLDGSGGGDLGTVSATSNRFPALLKVPAAAGAPAVTGGSLLSCSKGVWGADLVGSLLYRAPRSFTYQWSVNGAIISGATATTYSPSAPGDYRCRVTASNAAGGTSQTSAPHTVLTPSVSGFTPTSGIAGSTVVTISGSNLASASAVKFNSRAAKVGSDTPTQIRATVPDGATAGRISVTTAGGTATSASSFAVTFSLSAYAPGSGPTGTHVTLTGTGFTSTSSVKFNGVAATVLSRTPPTTLVAVVPAGASTGKITVTNTTAPVGTVTSGSSYRVTP
jgi:hypothetical protein